MFTCKFSFCLHYFHRGWDNRSRRHNRLHHTISFERHVCWFSILPARSWIKYVEIWLIIHFSCTVLHAIDEALVTGYFEIVSETQDLPNPNLKSPSRGHYRADIYQGLFSAAMFVQNTIFSQHFAYKIFVGVKCSNWSSYPTDYNSASEEMWIVD